MYESEFLLRCARVFSRSKILGLFALAHMLPFPVFLFVTLDIVILGRKEKRDADTGDANDDLVSSVI